MYTTDFSRELTWARQEYPASLPQLWWPLVKYGGGDGLLHYVSPLTDILELRRCRIIYSMPSPENNDDVAVSHQTSYFQRSIGNGNPKVYVELLK